MTVLALTPLCALVYPLSKLLDITLVRLREWEWEHHKSRPNGAEMYLMFVAQAPVETYDPKTVLRNINN